MTRSPLLPALLATLAALLLLPGSAGAATTFSNTDPITIPSVGPATPSPSAVDVEGLRGPITNVTVTLHKFGHGDPIDVDVLLVSPEGTGVILMSDACGEDTIEDFTWVFSDSALKKLPQNSDCGDSTYKPGNYTGGVPDAWPGAPDGNRFDFLSVLDGEDPDGTWRLFVVDDVDTVSGDIEGGWSLSIQTGAVDSLVPATGTEGKASRYPEVQTVSGRTGVLTDVDVSLGSIAHQSPDDLDILLVGPRGQKVVLMSDACAGAPISDWSWTWTDDGNVFSMPANDLSKRCSAYPQQFTPTNFGQDDVWPAPAPPGPYTNALSDFEFTDPNGDWKLFVNDDKPGSSGYVTTPFKLELATRKPAPVTFTESAVQLAEGTAAALTLERNERAPLGAGSVTVRTQAASASDGDFTPVSTTVQFAAGQRERAVGIAALTDGQAEPDETFAVALSGATGDVSTGDPSSVVVTIPAQAAVANTDPGAGGGGPAVVKTLPDPVLDRTNPVVTVVAGTKVLRDGTVKVRARCSEACTGTVGLASTKRLRTTRAAKPRRLTLGSAPFRLAGAGSTTVKIKLTASARKALRLVRSVAIKATATAVDQAANRGVGNAKSTLRR